MSVELTPEMKTIQEGIDKVKSDFNDKLSGKISKEELQEVKTMFDDLNTKFAEQLSLNSAEQIEGLKSELATTKEVISKMDVQIKNSQEVGKVSFKSFKEHLRHSVKEALSSPDVKDHLQKLEKGEKLQTLSLNLKDVSLVNDYSGETPMAAATFSGRNVDQFETINPRRGFLTDLLPNESTDGDAFVMWTETNGYREGSKVLSENEESGESVFVVEEKNEGLKRIGDHVEMSGRLVRSLPFVTNQITRTLPRSLQYKKDEQIMNGNGSGNNLTGLLPNARDFVTEMEQNLIGGSITSITAYEDKTLINYTGDNIIFRDFKVVISGSTNYTAVEGYSVVNFFGKNAIVIDAPFVPEVTTGWSIVATHPMFKTEEKPTLVDVLNAASLSLNFNEGFASTAIVNPADYLIDKASKKTNDGYVYNSESLELLTDLNIRVHNSIPRGQALVLDAEQATAIWTSTGMQLNIITGATDSRLAKTNKVGFYLQEELLQTIYNKELLLKVDIDAAKTALTK